MKAEKEINLQIMAFLDGELNEANARQIERMIKEDSEYRRIYESLRDLQEVTQEMKFKKLPEMYWDEYWKHVYNRIERGFSWIFISVGAIIVLGFISWQAIQSLIMSDAIHPLMKVGIILLTIGLVILFVSVIREKLMVRKVDKYREVER
jgi:hypothetical protein